MGDDNVRNQVGDLQTRVRILENQITGIQDNMPESPDLYADMAFAFAQGQ